MRGAHLASTKLTGFQRDALREHAFCARTVDVSALPTDIARQVEYVQGGPDSPTALIEAAHAIAQCSIEATIPVLVDMLGFNNPIAANIAIEALVRNGSRSIPSLLLGVGAFNYAVNAYALRALGRIGDPRVLDVCAECAQTAPIPNVRRAAVRAIGLLRYEHAGELSAACELLLALTQDADWSVRYSAVAALSAFAAADKLSSTQRANIHGALRTVAAADADPAVAARASLASASLAPAS
mmetsp:Transcript_13667/g.36717  ORF Transcript_13667/g.36717 Transcript_13667/m.36717 type:complete len:241 (+) Transcript_13667:262-984(+)|eukprot:CAMPEP_0185831832 /NCGR_PEP_ID=MMETSP1353-20130828/1732_1 /TAXON_ID=1077150 /ORGANISM="Erythrolobus australicus, Strain CCMP3124" /LENGTH=240 /DNA_ID=CAMNT_0028529941 /DNA_START=60 /DNA_END=782 /DNA_ORIENTATION=+